MGTAPTKTIETTVIRTLQLCTTFFTVSTHATSPLPRPGCIRSCKTAPASFCSENTRCSFANPDTPSGYRANDPKIACFSFKYDFKLKFAQNYSEGPHQMITACKYFRMALPSAICLRIESLL